MGRTIFLLILYIPFISACIAVNTGQKRASWSEQYALAYTLATEVDREAILVSVTAFQSRSDPTESFDTTFSFFRPSGQTLEVSMRDTDIHHHHALNTVGSMKTFTLKEARERHAVLNNVQISPYEAVQATLQYVHQHHIDEHNCAILVYYDIDASSSLAAWKVQWLENTQRTLLYWVHANTKIVIRQESISAPP